MPRPATSSIATPRRSNWSGSAPGWHKAVGVVILISGITVVILNQIMLGNSITLLPGGQRALLLLGVIIAINSTGRFGWFDREK